MTKAAVLALLPAGAIAGALRARQLQPFRASTDNVTYAGCFVDSVQQRVLTQGLFFDDFTLTAEVCSEHCLSMGLPISGTEYTAECYCGEKLPPVQVGDEECNSPCSGDKSQACGGADRISVYKAPLQPGPALNPGPEGWESIGCYTDDRAGRALARPQPEVNGPSLTVAICAKVCSGFAYFGVEYAGECYCGNTIDNERTLATTQSCDMACRGNSSELCGGPDRLNVYEAQQFLPTPTPIVTISSSSTETPSVVATPSATEGSGNSSTVFPTSSDSGASAPFPSASGTGFIPGNVTFPAPTTSFPSPSGTSFIPGNFTFPAPTVVGTGASATFPSASGTGFIPGSVTFPAPTIVGSGASISSIASSTGFIPGNFTFPAPTVVGTRPSASFPSASGTGFFPGSFTFPAPTVVGTGPSASFLSASGTGFIPGNFTFPAPTVVGTRPSASFPSASGTGFIPGSFTFPAPTVVGTGPSASFPSVSGTSFIPGTVSFPAPTVVSSGASGAPAPFPTGTFVIPANASFPVPTIAPTAPFPTGTFVVPGNFSFPTPSIVGFGPSDASSPTPTSVVESETAPAGTAASETAVSAGTAVTDSGTGNPPVRRWAFTAKPKPATLE